MFAPGDAPTGPPPAAPGDYWNAASVVEEFSTAPPPSYLAEVVPKAQEKGLLALDAGCGAGRNLHLLAERGYRVLGLDWHERMLHAARGKETGHLAQADVRRLPLRESCCAFVVCHGVLHNLPDRRSIALALKELRRTVAPSGRLSLNTFSSRHLDSALSPVLPTSERAPNRGEQFMLPNGQLMTLLAPTALTQLTVETGWRVIAGPYEYLSTGDPGARSVWRAVLEPTS